MKFLALSPLAASLLAVLTTAVLVAMYFLKLRHRKVRIASSILWSRVLDRREERSLWERLRWLLSVLLAVVIGLLMAFAIARPEITSVAGETGRTMIVLDTSPSMLARRSDGRTRWQHAVDFARSLVASGGTASEFRIADTAGQFDSEFTSDAMRLNAFIDEVRPKAAAPLFPESDDSSVQTYFITDGVAMPEFPKNVKTLGVFEAAGNTGITAFDVRSVPPGLPLQAVQAPLQYEAYLEVTNFGKDSVKTTIDINEAGKGHIAREIQIMPGHSYSEILDLSNFEGGGLRASIHADGDELSADDNAYGYLPLRKKTNVRLVTAGNSYLQAALKLDSSVELAVVAPKDYREDAKTAVYVFDGFAPPAQPSKPALIVGTHGKVPWLPDTGRVVEKPSFSTWVDDHPVMQYLALHDVSISRASEIDAPGFGADNLIVLAASGQTPLIVASPIGAGGARWIMLTFDLQASDFPIHESFPLFIDNSLAWFGRERLALRRTSGIVEVPIGNAQITGPDSKPVESRAYPNRTVFEAVNPGLYVAIKDGVRQNIAVNLMNRQYSNINRTSLNQANVSQPPARFLQGEPWTYLLLLAVLLLGLEWFTYHRRITL